jgi:hypothetical protein
MPPVAGSTGSSVQECLNNRSKTLTRDHATWLIRSYVQTAKQVPHYRLGLPENGRYSATAMPASRQRHLAVP